jgi:Na+/phosphate symporter
MPTQEERLQTVEFDLKQFKTETVKVYGDMAFEMTIIKGLTQELRQDIGEIGKRLDQTDTRLDRIETLLTQILARLPKAP